MIIIINKLQIHGKRFCENCVTGSNLGEREKGTYLSPGKRSVTRQDFKSVCPRLKPASPAAARCLPSSGTGR